MTNFENDMTQFTFHAFGGTLNAFRTAGMPVSSFAYPHGDCADWTHPPLLTGYHIVRGFVSSFQVYDTATLKKGGYIASKSIDTGMYGDNDASLKEDIRKMFILVKFMGDGYVIPLTSHTIASKQEYTGNYAIRPNNLKCLFQQGQEFKLKFYTFNDFNE
jgi:hypothetical protein